MVCVLTMGAFEYPLCICTMTWYVQLSGGLGGWSTEGCRMIGDNGNSISCACNHLTSFAIVQVSIVTVTWYIECVGQ